MQFVDKSQTKYPSLTNCGNVELGFRDDQSYLKFAQVDKEPTLLGHGHGIYQCYCKTKANYFEDIKDENNFCYTYVSDKLWGNIA